MSEDFSLFDDESEDVGDSGDGGSGDGRRSLWALAGVLAFALVVVAVAVVLLKSQPSSHRTDNQLAGPTEPGPTSPLPGSSSQSTGASASAASSSTSSPSHTSSSPSATSSTTASGTPTPTPSHTKIVTPTPTPSSTHSTPTPTPSSSTAHSTFPCPNQAPCIVGGDGGHAIDAVNAYRASLPHPLGPAQGAIGGGAQQCALGEVTQDETACGSTYAYSIESTQSGTLAVHDITQGSNWFDTKNLKFRVGWAYDPVTGEYYCAFLKLP